MDLTKPKQQKFDEEEVKVSAITMARLEEEKEEVIEDIYFSPPHWARVRTETPVKIGEKKEIVMALIDHGSEINLMLTEFYKKGVGHALAFLLLFCVSGGLNGPIKSKPPN